MSLCSFEHFLDSTVHLGSLFTHFIWTCNLVIFLLCLPLEIISRQGKVSSPLPKVFAMESSFSSFIQSNVKCLKRRYNEPLLIKLLGPNIHFLLSTILLPQLIYKERIRFVRELISTKDGGIVGIDWILFPTDDSLKRSIGMEEENEDRIMMIIPDPSEGRFPIFTL